MTLFEDLQQDYLHVDGIQTVTYTDESASTSVATVKADTQALDKRETSLAGQLGLQPNVKVWRVWSATLEGMVPDKGDSITDSESKVWTVKSLTETRHGTTSIFHRALCEQQKYA